MKKIIQVLCLVMPLGLQSCKSVHNNADDALVAATMGTDDFMNDAPIAAGDKFPSPNGKLKNYRLNREQVSALAAAMKEIDNAFYHSGSGYVQRPGTDAIDQDRRTAEVNKCLAAAPDRWGLLMQHYYCYFPGYATNWYPNIRECYTTIIRGWPIANDPNLRNFFGPVDSMKNFKGDPLNSYNYCVYTPTDHKIDGIYDDQGHLTSGSGEATGELWNWHDPDSLSFYLGVTPAKEASPAQGPLAWIKNHQDEIFKFIMFGTPCMIHPESQMDVLNEFYGVDLKGKTSYRLPEDAEQGLACNRGRWISGRNQQRIMSQNFEINDSSQCSYNSWGKGSEPYAEDCAQFTRKD